ncbi:MDMPI N domain containing protein [Actinoplanes sp. ATCC 53533]|uniref:maleylpyruvate isomerase family mycothiol-dependent enzyme n=1 Tax=Actinoplanes sp. ATCC 53533 TaxID=1288362 RepID=UPI000F787C2D|nr:maleylpyruvate isomerase family mycothiol-dependent enzyme [Actinoplanes sp. ATCC 53533]RSM42782.1 MDMPI N domain containing protein [Actinoplanes sp. ATCC 53533]
MTDTASHETVVALIGAWALDACSPAEAELVETHLGTCPACAREARELREVAADLGGAYLRPPSGSLARLRAAAPGRRRPATATAAYAAPYAAQVAALDLLLSDLAPEDWRLTAYGDLSVRDLLAHLAATDGLVAAGLGLPVQPPVAPGEKPATRTAAVLRFEQGWSPEQTRRSWRAQADAVCRSLAGRPSPGTATVTLGRPLPLADALAARAFETWIHGEDIAAATGRPAFPPLPEHVHPLADLAARVLPRVAARRLAPPHDRHVRLHLTGAGGGTWTVPLDPATTVPAAARPAAVVTLDVVEFCRLAADRREPGRIAVEIRGDTALARDFLAAVPTLAPVP